MSSRSCESSIAIKNVGGNSGNDELEGCLQKLGCWGDVGVTGGCLQVDSQCPISRGKYILAGRFAMTTFKICQIVGVAGLALSGVKRIHTQLQNSSA